MTKATWATCNITPPLGLPMGGRGPRLALGTEVIDPLEAGVILLEDDAGGRVLILSLDLIIIGQPLAEELCYKISAITGIHPDAVVINFSHTHSGPMMGFEDYASIQAKPEGLDEYEAFLVKAVLQMVIEADKNRHEVEVYWRDGQSNIGINRRLKTEEGVVMAPNPEGAYHRQLWTLEIQPVDKNLPQCILFSHACHPVIVYGHAWTAISSDWPGRCRRAVKTTLGIDTHVQFMQGLAGNIRPRILADLGKKGFRRSIPEDVELVGQEIATDILRTLEEPATALSLQLRAGRDWFMAYRSEAPPQAYWEATKDSEIELTRELSRYWLTRYGADAIPPYRVQPWPIGLVYFTPQHALAYVAGEPLSEWYAVFQEALPDARLVVCGYTHTGAAYLPTDELLEEGGYEVERAHSYTQAGPGAFRFGLNAEVKRSLHRLQQKKPRNNSGFTLIELLTVLTIVSVLVVLLMLGVSRWKGRAESTKCMGNLRRIAVMMNGYATEHNGWYPSGVYDEGYKGGGRLWAPEHYLLDYDGFTKNEAVASLKKRLPLQTVYFVVRANVMKRMRKVIIGFSRIMGLIVIWCLKRWNTQ